MPCVEYHLLLILICLMKSNISLNLRIELGSQFIKFLAPLPMTEQSLVAVSEIFGSSKIQKRVSKQGEFLG